MNNHQTKTNEAIDETTIKKIKSGEFRHCYLLYNRKSTDEPENQKNSIKYQKAENTRFAYKEQLPIAPLSLKGFCLDGIISEKHSGFKENTELTFGEDGTVKYRIDRPKFYQLVQFLSKGYFKGVIFLCWDRASRNKGDDTVIRKLMKQGLDFRFTLASYDKTSSGALHMDIDGMFAEHHSRVTSEKVSLNMRIKRDQGICTYKAPVGYLNEGIMEHKPLDPVRAPIIARMFEMYATGAWSLSDAARWAIEQGFTMTPSRRRRTTEEILAEEDDEDDKDNESKIERICRLPAFTTIHRILSNRFYVGEILSNEGKYVKSASHKAIVSIELFEQVQRILNKKKISVHYLERKKYPFRGILRCGGCQRVYTPYTKKGILYFGSHCIPNCSNGNKSVNINILTGNIGGLIEGLYFTENELEEINTYAKTDVAELENERQKKLEVIGLKKKKIKEDLTYLQSNKLTLLKTGAYTPDALVMEEENLNQQLITLEENEGDSEVSMHESIRDILKLSELLKNVYLYYHFANSDEKEQITRLIFSELTLFQNELKFKCKNGFQALENRFISLCGQTEWLSELQKSHMSIKESICELETIHNLPP